MPRCTRPVRVTPSLREYSFLDQCPALLFAACSQYEYLRCSQPILEAIARRRSGETDPAACAAPLLFGPDIFWAFQNNSWPSLPYLDAEQARSEVARGTPPEQKQKQKRNLAHLLTPWPHLYDQDNVARIVPVYIFPGLTMPQLKEGFGDLLDRDYPQLLKPLSLRPKRGRGSGIEQDRTDLKALTAWRLQKKFGYSAKAALQLMRSGRLVDTYANERTFYRAVERAAKKITALEAELKQFTSKI
jgi:hypothetical protein